jgi:NADP-dependent alcohol dehydrogenase
MNDFVWQSPTKVIFGRGKEELIGEELARAGAKRVLFVYGRDSIVKSGLYSRIIGSFVGSSICWVEHSGVTPNPVLSHVDKGIRTVCASGGIDAILAVGGGSVIDEAKTIAVALKTGDQWDHFCGLPITDALPIYTIPTISGSGSEVNCGAVLTNEDTKQKYVINSPLLYPKVSIVNPELMFTVPREYVIYGGVDAVTHALEAYVTSPGEKSLLLKGIINTLTESVLRTTYTILEEPNNYDARAEFAWASMLAGSGLPIKGLTGYNFPVHMISHSLSSLYDLPHGAALMIIFSAWLKWVKSSDSNLEFWLDSFSKSTHLIDWDIPESDIPMIAKNAMGLCRLWKMDKIYTQEAIETVLRLAI